MCNYGPAWNVRKTAIRRLGDNVALGEGDVPGEAQHRRSGRDLAGSRVAALGCERGRVGTPEEVDRELQFFEH